MNPFIQLKTIVVVLILLAVAHLASAQSFPRLKPLPPKKDATVLNATPALAPDSPWQLLTNQPPVLDYTDCGPGSPILLTDGNRPARQSVLRAISRANLKSVPVEWVDPCVALLRDQPRTATVRASPDANMRVSVLQRNAYLTAVTGYPASSAAGEEVVTARLRADAERRPGQ